MVIVWCIVWPYCLLASIWACILGVSGVRVLRYREGTGVVHTHVSHIYIGIILELGHFSALLVHVSTYADV